MLVNDLFEDNFFEAVTELSDIITARGLISQAMQNADYKHKYFEFLKYLRTTHGEKYSTNIHQKAAKMATAKEQD